MQTPSKTLIRKKQKNAFHNLLDKMESGGTLATSGVYTEAPLLGLSLIEFGDVPMPLTEHDACAIITHKAENFGK